MISVITPVYNAIAFIDETFAMMFAQDCTDWEWILVEDGSTDGTREKLAEYASSADCDSRVRIILADDNKNKAAGARNIGLDAAEGRYIAFLDVDDVWSKNKLSTQLDYMDKTGAAFCFTSYEFGDEQAKGTGRIVHAPRELTYRQALSRTVIFTSPVMFDTQKIDKSKLYMPYIASEDTATWWNILRDGVTATGLDEVLTIYRRPARSLSSNKLLAVKRIWGLYRDNEGMGVFKSIPYFIGWAFRATIRRI